MKWSFGSSILARIHCALPVISLDITKFTKCDHLFIFLPEMLSDIYWCWASNSASPLKGPDMGYNYTNSVNICLLQFWRKGQPAGTPPWMPNLYREQWKNCVEPYITPIQSGVPPLYGQFWHQPSTIPPSLPEENSSLWYSESNMEGLLTKVGDHKVLALKWRDMWSVFVLSSIHNDTSVKTLGRHGLV